MKRKLVMIGNGMVGMRAIEEILDIDNGMFGITIFGAEHYPNYNRIRLAEILTGKNSVVGLTLNDIGWYKEARITLYLGRTVIRIDRENRKVEANGGTTTEYDILIIATGSHTFMIPVPGIDKQGIVSFRNIADCNTMLSAAHVYQNVAVVGGGLLGLGAAYGLLYQGMQVTVVHDQAHLISHQLDATAGRMLGHKLTSFGMDIRTGMQITEILGGSRVAGLRFSDGSEVAADLVVMAAGIVPNTELANAAELTCDRGITVNGYMQTITDPAIYAVGECAECDNRTHGFVAPLFAQAKVLAARIAGREPAPYRNVVHGTQLNVSGVDIYSVGDFGAIENTEAFLYLDQGMDIFKKVVLQHNRVVGCILLDDTADGPRLFELIRSGIDISCIRQQLLQVGSGFSTGIHIHAGMDKFSIVCECHRVARSAVVDTIKQYSLEDLLDVMSETRAGRGCGACHEAIQEVLYETLAEMAA